MSQKNWSAEECLRRWPRLTAHLICESLGYFTPTSAARCIADYKNGKDNWCEYVLCCFGGKPQPVIERAFKYRHRHRGYMAHYPSARCLVDAAVAGLGEPMFASWF